MKEITLNMTETNKKIVSTIIKLRELKGLSQKQVAAALGITTSGYGKIERSEVALTIDRLEEIATILKVQLNDILGFNEQFIFNNHGTQQAQSAYAYFDSHTFDKERTLYEQQINILTQENQHLKLLIEKLLPNKNAESV